MAGERSPRHRWQLGQDTSVHSANLVRGNRLLASDASCTRPWVRSSQPRAGAALGLPTCPAPGEQNRGPAAAARRLGLLRGKGRDRAAPPVLPWGGHAGSLSSVCVYSGLVLLVCSCSRPAFGFNSSCVLWHAPCCITGYSLAISHTPTVTLLAGGPQLLISVRTVLPLHSLSSENLGDQD